MTNEEYIGQLQGWSQLTPDFSNDSIFKLGVAQNKNWSELYGGKYNLGNTTLNGADAELVSQYFAAKGYVRNEEWISSNPESYWMRQLSDAQNWAMTNDKTQGQYQAEMGLNGIMGKSQEMTDYQTGLNNKLSNSLSSMNAQVAGAGSVLRNSFDSSIQGVQSAQSGLSNWVNTPTVSSSFLSQPTIPSLNAPQQSGVLSSNLSTYNPTDQSAKDSFAKSLNTYLYDTSLSDKTRQKMGDMMGISGADKSGLLSSDATQLANEGLGNFSFSSASNSAALEAERVRLQNQRLQEKSSYLSKQYQDTLNNNKMKSTTRYSESASSRLGNIF